MTPIVYEGAAAQKELTSNIIKEETSKSKLNQ